MKQRIWELDAFRGLFILCMVLVHLAYDLVELYGLVSWEYPAWFTFLVERGGILFFLLSGICATLGSRSLRRGIIVFTCGMIVSAVTLGMYTLGMADKGIIIYFGVLHCLGACMMLWPLFRKLPWWALLVLGGIFIGLGHHFETLRSDTLWLLIFGIPPRQFSSSDYFPLLPYLGYFLAGAALGCTAYAKGTSMLPNVRADKGILGFLQKCGRHSLWIYLLHQPVISGICWLVMMMK